MSTAIMVVVVLAVVVILVVAGLAMWRQSKTKRLRSKFGPEYDRAVEQHGGRAAAERELAAREHEHDELELKALEPQQREQYREHWGRVQETFVDSPKAAVEQADRLVIVVMEARGYPTGGQDFEERAARLSVEHGPTLDHYRSAHTISDRAALGDASTEDLRQAMIHYRALFDDLLTVPGHDEVQAPHEDGEPAHTTGGRYSTHQQNHRETDSR